MTGLDLQQYKYRRNFPYNDTIKEESAEMLSENKSSVTFTSALVRGRPEQAPFPEAKRKSVFSNQGFDGQSPDDEFDMKSENLVRNYSNRQEHQEVYLRNMHAQEISNFNKQSSEKYFKNSPAMENFRVKKVAFRVTPDQRPQPQAHIRRADRVGGRGFLPALAEELASPGRRAEPGAPSSVTCAGKGRVPESGVPEV